MNSGIERYILLVKHLSIIQLDLFMLKTSGKSHNNIIIVLNSVDSLSDAKSTQFSQCVGKQVYNRNNLHFPPIYKLLTVYFS